MGGGTKRILHFACIDLWVVSHLYFTSNLPPKGLKMIMSVFYKNHFSKFDPYFSILGNPRDPEKKFFRKFFPQKINGTLIFYPIAL